MDDVVGPDPQRDAGGEQLAPAVGAAHAARVALLAGTAIGAVAIGLLLWARSGFADPPQIFMDGPIGLLSIITATLTQTAGGLIIAVRRPGNMVGWVILLFAVAIAIDVLVNGYLALVGTGWPPPVDPAVMALLPGVLSFSLGTFTAVVLGMIFPDGHIAAPRYRPFVAAAAFGALFFSLGVAGTPGPLLWFPTIDNPLPVPGDTIWPALARYVIGPSLLVAAAVATSVALMERYRRNDEIGRLQLRWYVASATVLTVGFVAYVAALYTLPDGSILGELIMTSFFFAAALPPIAMVIAISRYHLYDIDVIIGRAFVYGALTAILAGLYAASIRLFNAVFVGLTGESSELELVITTLILATTFTPIKNRLERFAATRMAGAAQIDPTSTDPATQAVLDDPAFATLLDERIRAALGDQPPLEVDPTREAASASEPQAPAPDIADRAATDGTDGRQAVPDPGIRRS